MSGRMHKGSHLGLEQAPFPAPCKHPTLLPWCLFSSVSFLSLRQLPCWSVLSSTLDRGGGVLYRSLLFSPCTSLLQDPVLQTLGAFVSWTLSSIASTQRVCLALPGSPCAMAWRRSHGNEWRQLWCSPPFSLWCKKDPWSLSLVTGTQSLKHLEFPEWQDDRQVFCSNELTLGRSLTNYRMRATCRNTKPWFDAWNFQPHPTNLGNRDWPNHHQPPTKDFINHTYVIKPALTVEIWRASVMVNTSRP